MNADPIELDDNYNDNDVEAVTDPVIDDHPLVVAVCGGAEGPDLLHAVAEALARHQAELAWLDLHRHEFESEDLLERGRAISRSGRALRRMAELEVARIRRFGTQPTDLHADPQVKRVLSLLLDRICEVGRDVLPASKADELNTKIRAAVEAAPEVPWP